MSLLTSIVAYWKLDENTGTTAADSVASDTASFVTSTGSGPTWVTGKINTGIQPASLGPNSGWLTAATLTALQGDNDRSVSMWFNLPTYDQNYGMFDCGDTSGTLGTQFEFFTSAVGTVGGSPGTNTAGFYLTGYGNDVYVPGFVAMGATAGTWVHVVVTLTGTSVTIYINNTQPQGYVTSGGGWTALLSQPFTLPVTPNTLGNPILLGHTRVVNWGTGATIVQGTIDEIGIWSRVLSSAEVSQLYNSGAGLQYPFPTGTTTYHWNLTVNV